MRECLRQIQRVPDHVGLAYDTWAPVGPEGKVPDADDKRAKWLAQLASLAISPDYARAFERWRSSFAGTSVRLVELTLVSRLLVGHGNASATDVGLEVHHTWGVPTIPGSALKGLLAHYVDAVYGPSDPSLRPWEQPDSDEQARARLQGTTWDKQRIQRGPGDVFRTLFGAPDADEDGTWRDRGIAAGATVGSVVFHDALYIPGSAPENRAYSTDVLTVHQKEYYGSLGKTWPCDYDGPNPIAFLTVRPQTKLLFALSDLRGGNGECVNLAMRLLLDALREWGVGGKTTGGYGRLLSDDELAKQRTRSTASEVSPGPKHKTGERITVIRVEDAKGKPKFRAPDGLLGHFAGEDPPGMDVGEKAEVWVANMNDQGYTLTVRQPKEKKR
jgi:CRISPR-associated protein Cmr6